MTTPEAAMVHDEASAWAGESLERERSQSRLLVLLATVLIPAWIPFDFLLEPQAARTILVLRLLDVAVGLACLLALPRLGSLRAVRGLTVLKVVSTGVTIALMLPLVEVFFWPYVLGFSLLFWASAVILSMPWAVVGGAWAVVLAVAVGAVAWRPELRSFEELAGATFYLASMVIICLAQVALRGRLERRAFLSAHRLAEASRKVLESEAQKTRFFANVSHELRTPLTLILGPAEKLLAAGEASSEERASLELIVRNAHLLLGQVNDLLEVTRLDVGATALRYAQVDLARLVRTVASHFELLAEERGITYAVDTPERLPAELDADKIRTVLLNLLSNAFKATPAGGRIRCVVEQHPCRRGEGGGQRAFIEVGDSGPGILPEHRAVVFERFRQVGAGGSGSSGLGLTIAKDFVELHHGSIAVAEAREGGAAFRVELPLSAPAGSAVEHGHVPSRRDDPRTRQALAALQARGGDEAELVVEEGDADRPLVLVVEDHPELNRFLREGLAPDYRTVSALDGRTGLEQALALHPDLIVSDLMMPGMTGEELVAAVRARPELQKVPIVVLSAREDEALRVRLLEQGAQDYVTKPFSVDELRARVGNLIAVGRARALLQADLDSREDSLEKLAREVTYQRRELATSLESTRVARDLAERACDLKSSFLRMVSHELRSPLTTLMLQIHRLERAPEPADRPLLLRMKRSAVRLGDLVEGLLEYARIESGRLLKSIETFDVVELARATLDDVRPQAEAKGLSLELESPHASLPPLTSDPRLVRLVLSNLLVNAIKFTEVGGVTVRVDLDGGTHRLTVQDTGPGISPSERDRIFEPFEQLGPSRSKHVPGVGLGLALVREVVRALGGSIELDSTAGRGSTFMVRLPPPEQQVGHAEDRALG